MSFIEWGYGFFILLCATTFVGVFLVAALYIYWGYFRIDEILGYLGNCKFVAGNTSYLYMGLWGRILMVGMVAGFLAFSKTYIERGGLDAGDIAGFPRALKRRLALSHYVAWVLGGSMLLSVGMIKLIGLYLG